MSRYRTILFDLKLPITMVRAEVSAFAENIDMRAPAGSELVMTYDGEGVAAGPYLNRILSGYTFVGLTPIALHSESRFILRFVFSDGTVEMERDALSAVRRKMHVHWLGYYLDRYNAKSIRVYEAPYAGTGGGNFLTVLFDDLVLVVDERGKRLGGPTTGSDGEVIPERFLHYDGDLVFDNGMPRFRSHEVYSLPG